MTKKLTLKFLVRTLVNQNGDRCDLAVYVNHKLFYCEQKIKEGLFELLFGEIHEDTLIQFVIKNKKEKYTLINKDKQILSDTAFEIEKIMIGDYDYKQKINFFSNYYTEKNGVVRTHGYMGFNGSYNFKFRYPLSKHTMMCEYH